jgi:Domain of unknown function (DUF4136)
VRRRKLVIAMCLATFCRVSLAQKVKVGYDKSVDFSRYKTYTWEEPAMPPTRPHLYATVIGSVDGELHAKGLSRIERNGDLILIPAGGIGFAIVASGGKPLSPTFTGPPPAINATVWTGAEGQGQLMPAVPEGTLVLEFVDRTANVVVWSGTVTQKLDIENKNQIFGTREQSGCQVAKAISPENLFQVTRNSTETPYRLE